MCCTNTWWIPWWLQGSGVYFAYYHCSLKNEPLCMMLWFLWKLMLFMLWKTSQNNHWRIDWGWKWPLEDIWPNYQYIYRHWGSEECRCIYCLPWVLVHSLTSTLLLAWALNSCSFVIWQVTYPFVEAAELALSQLCRNSSGQEGAGGCSSWLLERHGLQCSHSVTLCVSWCCCHCWAWNSSPIRVLTLYRI